MQILPVMDLKGGKVVHAVAGQREKYEPIRSRFVASAAPELVARMFADRFHFREVYVADLEAIAGEQPSWSDYARIAKSGLELVVDAGITTPASARSLKNFAREHSISMQFVIGSESLRDKRTLRPVLEICEPDDAIFSLDLRHGMPLVADANWVADSITRIVAEVVAVGFRRIIVLDLAAVGTGNGPATLALCGQLRREFPLLKIISGGGVRGTEDVQHLCDAGCDQILVASALHDGRLLNPSPL